jgi:hypothetical protein
LHLFESDQDDIIEIFTSLRKCGLKKSDK